MIRAPESFGLWSNPLKKWHRLRWWTMARLGTCFFDELDTRDRMPKVLCTNSTGTFGWCRPLVHANVIDLHYLRKHSCRIRIAGKTSADCHVEKDKEWMIENPRCSLRQVGWRSCFVQQPVNIEPNHVRLPLDCKSMKIVGELLAARQSVGCRDTVCSRIARSMKRAVNERRF